MDLVTRQRAEETLSSRGWLAAETPEFRKELFRFAVMQVLPAGTVAYRVGDPPGGIYGLVAGALAVGFADAAEMPRLLQFAAVGSWIGVVPFLSDGVRLAELRAATDCRVMHVPLAAMEAMAARDPAAIRAFARILLANLEAALDLLRILMLPTAERRIAAALLRAGQSGGSPIPITQAELAAITNTSHRQVSETLRVLARQGLVEAGYRAIRLLDAEGLRKRALYAPG